MIIFDLDNVYWRKCWWITITLLLRQRTHRSIWSDARWVTESVVLVVFLTDQPLPLSLPGLGGAKQMWGGWRNRRWYLYLRESSGDRWPTLFPMGKSVIWKHLISLESLWSLHLFQFPRQPGSLKHQLSGQKGRRVYVDTVRRWASELVLNLNLKNLA